MYFRGHPAGLVDKGGDALAVSSTGADIWNNADQFRFVYKSLSGNGSITARVDGLTRSDGWAKAGVMIRETLDAGSKHAMVVVTPDNGISFQRRETTAGASTSAAGRDRGSTVLGPNHPHRQCPQGRAVAGWQDLDPDRRRSDPAMTANVYIGLCVTSHNVAAFSTAEFSNIAAAGAVTGSWQSASIGVTQRSNDAAALYVTVEDKAGKKKTVTNPNPAATTVGIWTEWRIASSDLAGVNLAAVKKITLGVGDRTSPQAGATGMLYIDDILFGHPVQ